MSTAQKLQKPLVFNHTPESVLQITKDALERRRSQIQALCQNVQNSDASFETVMVPFFTYGQQMSISWDPFEIYKYASPDKKVRDAVSEAEKLKEDDRRETYSNEDLFKLVDAVFQSTTRDTLDKESQILLEDEHREFIDKGMNLSADKRKIFLELDKQLSDLAIDFSNNINNDSSGIWLTKEELVGVPSEVVDELEKGKDENEGKLWLTMKYPHFFPTLENAINAETRRKALICFESRCPDNIDIFRRVILLRDEIARMQGSPNYAAYTLSKKMAKTPENVNTFLSNIRSKLQEGGKNELKLLKELKKTHLEKQGMAFNDKYFIWDHQYYNQLMQKEQFAVDQLKLKEYFELQTTLTKMCSIFEKSFGIVFKEVTVEERKEISPTGSGKDLTWHEDVQMFTVWDDETEGSAFLGYLYLDMFPREGKYGHACMMDLVSGFTKEDGSRQYPVVTLITNFPKPSTKKPSLLNHKQVRTLFHELGHCLHSLLSRTRFRDAHGPNVKGDFVEAPSQMLEHWVWEPSQLKYFGHHYSYLSPEYRETWEMENKNAEKQPSKELPDDMIQSLVKSKNVNSALFYLRQLHFSSFDMRVHGAESHEELEKTDFQALYYSMQNDTYPLDAPEDPHWSHRYSSINHFISTYAAGYYGYLYSRVFAADMYYTAFKKNPASTETGRRYRYTVLEKGGSMDPMDLLEDFLGRKPQRDAFYKDIGLEN